MNPIHTIRAAMAFGAAVGISAAASAQVMTPTQFKEACETPGNTVTVVGTLKVSSPTLPPPLVTVDSGCQVVLTPDSQFEGDNLNMRFAETVSFQAAAKATVSLKGVVWSAPSLSAALTGQEASVLIDESRIAALAGDVTLTLGSLSKLGITGPINGVGQAIAAAGAITVTAGEKFAGIFETTRLRAGTGMAFSMAGPEAVFAASNTSFVSGAGAFTLSSPGGKAQVDLAGGQVSGPSGVSVILPGAESKVTISRTRAMATLGSIMIQAGAPGASAGVLAIDRANIRAGGAYTMIASVGANKGEAVLGNSRIVAGAILIQSDVEGLTNLLNNTLWSATSITASTGSSGACIAEGNRVTAQVMSICQ